MDFLGAALGISICLTSLIQLTKSLVKHLFLCIYCVTLRTRFIFNSHMAKTAADLYFFARLSRDLNILSFPTHTPPIRQSHAPTKSTIKSWFRHWLYIAYHCPKDVSSLCIDQGVIIIIFDLLSINVFISMKFWAILKYWFYDFDRCSCSKRRLFGRLSIDVSTTYLSDLLNWRLGQQKAGNY